MKNNLLEKMTSVLLLDRDGNAVAVDIKVLASGGCVSVFMSDKTANPGGLISRNAANFLTQLIQRLGLHFESTRFYRHVFHPQQGSMFGRFDILWSDAELTSYKFVMLNNLDEGQEVKEWIAKASVVPITYGQTRCIIPPVSAVQPVPAVGFN